MLKIIVKNLSDKKNTLVFFFLLFFGINQSLIELGLTNKNNFPGDEENKLVFFLVFKHKSKQN